MLFNISDVLTSEGKVTTAEVPVEMNAVKYMGESFPIVEKNPVRFTFTNIGTDKARVEGETRFLIRMACDRCLKEVLTEIVLRFAREVSAEQEASQISDEDDAGVMEGYQLNVETLVYNEILMNWPLKVLCTQDCKGICRQCGRDLNSGECGCDNFVPDPRMAVIKDIFNANKEV